MTPLKPYEAMATGRAVVVSDVPALREMIIEGQTAVSFKAGSPDSLAAVCVKLCQTPDRRRELGANAARWVRSHRSWTAVAAGYLEAYEYAIDAQDQIAQHHAQAPQRDGRWFRLRGVWMVWPAALPCGLWCAARCKPAWA